jgi:hypothetical protein
MVGPEEMARYLSSGPFCATPIINGFRFDANLWDPSLLPAEAVRRAGRPAGFEMHPQPD